MRPLARPPAEAMEQVIFKTGPNKNITVCVSFFPNECGIDDLFEDAIDVLCADIGMEKEELRSKFNFESEKSYARIVAAQKMIRENTAHGLDDPYNMAEHMVDHIPLLKQLRNSEESYQRRKARDIDHAEILANHRDYSGSFRIFIRYMKDIHVRLRVFLCKLAQKDSECAKKIMDRTEDKEHYIYGLMTFVYDCFVHKNFSKYVESIADFVGEIEENSFLLTMLLRIKTIIAE